jgi:dTMP kinase
MVKRSARSPRLHSRRIVIPKPTARRRFYGHGICSVDLNKLVGKLIVVEGADGSGRSTQIVRLVDWLEGSGHATVQVGLKRSTLVSEELDHAKRGNILSRTTLSLFYATDFADQLENAILPGLRAGAMVLADRYIYTLMARDLVRGMDEEWLKNLYGMAIVPDSVDRWRPVCLRVCRLLGFHGRGVFASRLGQMQVVLGRSGWCSRQTLNWTAGWPHMVDGRCVRSH